MYFNQFPKMVYDIKGDNNYKVVPNIFRRIKVKNKMKDTVPLLDKYAIQDGETPETLAYKVYGNAKYHWIILLLNNIQNRYYDWPLSNIAFDSYITDKYDDVNGIHHYEKTQSSGKKIGNGPEDFSHMIECNSTDAGAGAVTNLEYEVRIQNKKRLIKLLDSKFVEQFIEEFRRLIR